MRTVFMGTPDFAACVLQRLYDSGNTVELVITQQDKARDRGKKVKPTPVREKAEALGIEVMQPEKIKGDADTLKKLAELSPDVIVVAAYGQILPEEILKLPKYGCVNVHASLLPKYRGAAPIQRAIADGEEKTGVTIMQMDRGLDTGDMLASAEVAIGNATGGRLSGVLAETGAELLVKTLGLMEEGKVKPVKQDDAMASYAGMIRKQDGKLDFSRPAPELERLVRAFDPWPGTFCIKDGQPFKVWAAAEACGRDADSPASGSRAASMTCGLDAAPGTVLEASPGGIRVACGSGVLTLTEVQAPGKKRMSAGDYLKGSRLEKGSVLE